MLSAIGTRIAIDVFKSYEHPMKYVIIILTSMLAVVVSRVAFGQGQSLKVTIDNVADDHGFILIALYRSADDFMNNRFMSLKLPAAKKGVSAFFSDVPSGEYAISVLHDRNNDMKLNKNAIGIPVEGVGFSNNEIGRFGPPDFERVAFMFPQKSEQVIKLKYW